MGSLSGRYYRAKYCQRKSTMVANGKAPQDVEANEATGLLDQSSASPAESVETAEERLWQELEQPWPATFERSISLLASPSINPKEAEHFTKSPKPGNTPLAAIRYQVRKSF